MSSPSVSFPSPTLRWFQVHLRSEFNLMTPRHLPSLSGNCVKRGRAKGSSVELKRIRHDIWKSPRRWQGKSQPLRRERCGWIPKIKIIGNLDYYYAEGKGFPTQEESHFATITCHHLIPQSRSQSFQLRPQLQDHMATLPRQRHQPAVLWPCSDLHICACAALCVGEFPSVSFLGNSCSLSIIGFCVSPALGIEVQSRTLHWTKPPNII